MFKHVMLVSLLVLVMAGCATTRTINPADQSVQSGPIKMDWWRSNFEPGMERRTNEVVSYQQHRQVGGAWYQKELQAAVEGKVVEAPTTQVAGSLPVVFVNERSRGIWLTYWDAQDPNPRKPRVYIPALWEGQANFIVEHLRAGNYCFSATDKYGREVSLRQNPDDKAGLVGEFPVFNEPLRPWMGNDYFGRLILPNH